VKPRDKTNKDRISSKRILSGVNIRWDTQFVLAVCYGDASTYLIM
jgi:hypothetical protein